MLLQTVFQFRTLLGKCDLGVGLEWDEIDHMSRIEHAFASNTGDGRRYRRQAVELSALMRGDQIHDRVDVVEMGPGGLVCINAPFIARGELVELVIASPGSAGARSEANAERSLIDDGEDSYRFVARGVWLKDEGNDYRVGLRFVGMPVKLHKAQISQHILDVVDKISAAA
jgi:hypothetical protein